MLLEGDEYSYGAFYGVNPLYGRLPENQTSYYDGYEYTAIDSSRVTPSIKENLPIMSTGTCLIRIG